MNDPQAILERLRQHHSDDLQGAILGGYDSDPIFIDARMCIKDLLRAIRIQGSAVITGMNAATEISSHRLQRARQLEAESRPDMVESERSANAILTEENDRLRALIISHRLACPMGGLILL